MKTGIVSREQELYATRSLAKAGIVRGHDLRTINPLRCYLSITSNDPSIHYMGGKTRKRGVK